eukprot:1598352-Ditylum_brightwellii.AAC.1
MIAFGMKTTLVQFQDNYYNYKGVVGNDMVEASEDDNGLAIGAFESAFCADTGATFVYEMCENIIGKMNYARTYRDDGLTIFEGRKQRKKQSGGSATSNSRLMKWSEGPSLNSLWKFGTCGKLSNYSPLMKRSPPMNGTSWLKK